MSSAFCSGSVAALVVVCACSSSKGGSQGMQLAPDGGNGLDAAAPSDTGSPSKLDAGAVDGWSTGGDGALDNDAQGTPNDAPSSDGNAANDSGMYTPTGYHLVWQDLFDTGTTPSTSTWGMYDSAGNAGNGLRRPSAFSVHDGMVDVVAREENGEIVSGGMAATNSQTYGYFEFRVRSDADPSQATDAVVLTWPDDNDWPEHGENDIYETGTGASRDPFNSYVHYGTTGSTQYAFAEPADGKQWHVMGMEWTATQIAIYRDGTLVGTVTNASAIPMVNHHVCIQLDAYQTMIGAPTHMYVDWVAVFAQ